MKCQSCGREIANDSKFCEFCGAKISKQNSHKSLWIAIVVGICVILLAGVSYYVYKQYENAIAEAKAAQEKAERQAAEAEAKIAEYSRKARLRAQGWVDLGLPSGTLWKDRNEEGGLYTYNQAVAKFGNNLPTKEQFEELKNSCCWTWTGDGYKIESSSGESITLSAAGCFTGYSYISGGYYWSSTLDSPRVPWCLYFLSSEVGVGRYTYSDWKHSVRLVK